MVYLIGLTGGIGAGKSTVARRLALNGAQYLDADELARRAVASGTEALRLIELTFGAQVIRPDGSLDRSELGAVVFSDEDARRRLNRIVHPAIKALSDAELSKLSEREDVVVVFEIPLLAESSSPLECDLVVVVEASHDARLRRLIEDRGYTHAHAVARMDAQASDDQRRALADVVIRTDVPIEETYRTVDDLWERVIAREAPAQ